MFPFKRKKTNNKIVAFSKADLNIKNAPHISEEIEDLLWFENGPKKNFVRKPLCREVFTVNKLKVTMTSFGPDEPSLINVKDIIIKPQSEVTSPSYYPFYSELSPEQRYEYWSFLANPYSGNHDIGYVFIFYYGLERHLFEGKFEKAFDMILRLRDIYDNSSFQHYSADACVLACILHQNANCAMNFMRSIDKEFEYKFNPHVYFFCKDAFGLPVTPEDIFRYYRAFSFDNNRYIKNNPELFLNILKSNFQSQFNSDKVLISSLILHRNEVSTISLPIFANVSIRDNYVEIPNLINTYFGGKMLLLLQKTHEDVKKVLAEQRKAQRHDKQMQTKKES